MPFEIKKVYTNNPYVDELVYYTKFMGLDTVLKMQAVADQNETAESLKAAGIYISCVENTVVFEMFDKCTTTALNAAGIIEPNLVNHCLKSIDNVPLKYRDAVTKALSKEYIENYVELNKYYRMLHGLPPIGHEDYVENWIPENDTVIDLSKPVHEMSNSEVLILEREGVLEDMIKEDPDNRLYMRHLGKRKIDIYMARRANRFDPLYIPKSDCEPVEHIYREKLDANKFYVLRTVYSEAFNYNSDYYDNFIAVFIVLITVVDIIARVQEFIARKEIFDIRSCQYLFESYGVPFFAEIPLKYQIAMVKNLHTLLKYKSTAKCMIEICSLFGMRNIQIFKYYLLKDRTVNLKNGDYIYSDEEPGSGEQLEDDFELKFLKVPLEENLNDYIRVSSNYIDYDEITTGDVKWDGGIDHDMIKHDIMREAFNFTRTKYISIDTIYDISKMAIQQAYFFNFLYDNVDLESLLTIKVPYIEPGKNFKIADIFTLLTVLTYYYRGVKDMIMDTQSKVLYINGFNFKADLAYLAETLIPNINTDNSDVIPDKATIDHVKEQINKFQIPQSSIPSFNEMMDMYVNNLEVRDELIKGMLNADNKREYDIYKKLYDALMTVELTMDYYKNPETGDFYRDEEGDATYSEFLKHQDPALYYVVTEVQSFEDDESRNSYIANLIDSIVYALEEFIDTEEFSGLFYNLPVMSAEAIKQYIATVINFYKSYKVDFLGLNTIYVLDDKEGAIQLLEDILLGRYHIYADFAKVKEYIHRLKVTTNPHDTISLIERIYLDIKTWRQITIEDEIEIKDIIAEILTKLVYYSVVKINEKHYLNVDHKKKELIHAYDLIVEINNNFSFTDNLGIQDKMWIYTEGEDSTVDPFTNLMSSVPAGNEGAIVTVDTNGDSKAGINIEDIATEKDVVDIVEENALSKEDITTEVSTDNPSNEVATTEEAVAKILRFYTL